MAFDIEGNEDSLKKNSKQALVLALIDIRDNFRDKVVECRQLREQFESANKLIVSYRDESSSLNNRQQELTSEIRASLLTAMAMKGYNP
jgi:hypothetical protein